MTKDEIIEMARQAGGMFSELPMMDAWVFDDKNLVAFANLVAQHERSACAKVIEECNWPKWADATDARDVFAEAIRARTKP